MIHSLNLNEGGGIIHTGAQSKLAPGASVAIGIGGTGVAALKELKKKVFAQLEPSNPEAELPEYKQVKFIAIDSDDTDIPQNGSVNQINVDTEFQGIKNANLATVLSDAGKRDLRTNPKFNEWMNIEPLKPLQGEAGAGGIRQIGRYLLLNNVDKIYNAITSAMRETLSATGAAGTVNVHIFAGISGGTGSGCFIDTCYLVRHVMESNGWNGKVFGYFFLPDVVISKQEVSGDAAKSHLNRRNGFAAFKELDYLMDLPGANDYFEQKFNSTTVPPIKTQLPPVDLCHLLSATAADGSIPANGFNYAINVASDYVMAYLADVTPPTGVALGAGDSGLTMQGHAANIVAGVDVLPREAGATHNYTVLGASNAEFPFTQIATYLAAGYYDKFLQGSNAVATDAAVDQLAKEMQLSVQSLYQRVLTGAPGSFNLDNIPKNNVYQANDFVEDTYPESFVRAGKAWLSACEGVFEDNVRGATASLEGYGAPERVDAIVARLHQKLLQLCLDQTGTKGPHYAATLIHRAGRDLVTVIDGLMVEADRKAVDSAGYARDAQNDTNASKVKFNTPGFFGAISSSAFESYKNDYKRFKMAQRDEAAYQQVVTLLTNLKRQVTRLSEEFYAPLAAVLNELKETFEANKNYLASPKALEAPAYTWRIVNITDPGVKDTLDAELRTLKPEDVVHDFMDYILKVENQAEWLSNKDYRIGKLVSKHIDGVFSDTLNRSLESYVRDMFPGQSDGELMNSLRSAIFNRADQSATPMYWCDPHYDIAAKSFSSSSLSVPAASSLLCTAAQNFVATSPNKYALRRSGVSDRIFVLRFHSGIPLYSYQGVTLLGADYHNDLQQNLAGMHLFEVNTVLEQKTDKTPEDFAQIAKTHWGTFLPNPLPYSRLADSTVVSDQVKDHVTVYDAALDVKIVAQDAVGSWKIFQNNNVAGNVELAKVGGYTKDNFMDGPVFSLNKVAAEKAALEEALKTLHQPERCISHALLSNGHDTYADATRKDNFLRFPCLVRIAKAELDKVNSLKAAIAELDALETKVGQTAGQTSAFINALLVGSFTEKPGRIEYTYTKGRFGEESIRLTDAESALSVKLRYFKAYKGYLALEDDVRAELDACVQNKMNNLDNGDDAFAKELQAKLDKVYLGEVSMECRKLVQDQADEIMAFYNDMLDQLANFVMQF